MVFKQFVEKVCSIDRRNKFITPVCKNKDIHEFYHFYDPIDVEFNTTIGTIRMFSIDEIESEASNYAYLNADFVFAAINGDAIFVKHGGVYICDHGSSKPTFEKLAGSFDEFIKNII